MDGNRIGGGILILCLILFMFFINGCKEPVSLQSKWLDKKIVIDADDIDWKDYPYFYDEDTRTCIGLYNDDKNLYLCFQTMDEKIQQQILHRGLYIWFNKTGGKDKELALCFPLGGGFGGPGGSGGPGGPPDRSRDIQGPPPDMTSDMSGPPRDISKGQNNPARRPMHQGTTPYSRIKIMTSEDDEGYNCSVERAARMGIEVSYRVDERNRFIYELKMPLVETEKTVFKAEASATNQIGMGFMTMKTGRGDMGRGGPGGGMGGGRGGPGGGMGGGSGGGPGGPGGGMGGGPGGGPGGGMSGGPGGSKSGKAGSLEIWTNVTLASKP